MLYFICDIMKKTKIIKILIILLCVLILIPIGINFLVIFKTFNYIYEENDINTNYDMAIVLGCGIKKNGEPSKMLKDRLNTAINVYNNGYVKNILITGDHSIGYSEVDVMYNYLLENGISSDVIIRDDYGFSTSESIINYKENYSDKSGIIITQKYHMYRALYIAQKISLNVIGVHAKNINYNGQFLREIREILARNKDYIKMMFN